MSRLRDQIVEQILGNTAFNVSQDQLVERLGSPSLILTYEYWLVLQNRMVERAKLETSTPRDGVPNLLLTRAIYNLCNVRPFLATETAQTFDKGLVAAFTLDDVDLAKFSGAKLSPLHFHAEDFRKPLGEGESLSDKWQRRVGTVSSTSTRPLPWAPDLGSFELLNELIGLHSEHSFRYRTLAMLCAYGEWLTAQLEVIKVDLRQVADPISAILHDETRRRLEGRMSQLRSRDSGSIGWVEQRSIDFARAKEQKTKLKGQFLDLLHKYGLRRFRRFVKGYSVDTAQSDLRELLQELRKKQNELIGKIISEKGKLADKLTKEIEKLEADLRQISRDRLKVTQLREELRRANEENQKAVKGKILDLCHDYGVNRLRRTLLRYSEEKALNDLQELGAKLVTKTEELERERGEKRRERALATSKKITKWQQEIKEIREDRETANLVVADLIIAQKEKASALSDVEQGIANIKDLSEDVKAMNIEFMSALSELRSIWEHIKSISTSPRKKEEQLQLVQDQIRENIALMMRLLEQRELMEIQRSQIEKTLTGKAKRGLKVSCGFANFSYPLLLKIGSLVAGNPSLKKSLILGAPSLISQTSAFSESQSLHNSLDFGKSIFDVGVAKLIKDTGTGSLTISLSLGLAYGSDTVGFFEAGVSLVYTAKLSVADDRKFRAAGSIAINGSIKAGHKAVLEAAAEADLIKDTTVFVFNDHYQWAAWLALKWANTAAYALALGANIYESSRTGAPTVEEAEYIKSLAEVYAAESKTISKTLEKIMPFMTEPVIRGDMLETMTNIKGSLRLGSMIGIEGSRERPPTKCEFYRRITTEEGGLREQENSSTLMSATAGKLTVGNFSPSLKKSVIRNHPNPDNDGDYLTFGLSVGDQTRTLVGEGSSGSTPQFIEDLNNELDVLDVEDNSDNGPLISTKVVGIASQTNLAELEVNLVKYPTPDESNRREKKKWRMQYIRGVNTKHVKAEVPIPIVVAPGLKVTFGADFKLSRTYGEIIFPETMTYWHTVYNGFTSIPSNDVRVEGETNDCGEEKWKRFTEDYKWSLRLFLTRLKSSSAPARQEIRDASQGKYPSVKTAGDALMRSPTLQNLEKYLKAYKEHVWTAEKNKLWKTKQRTVRFSLNPIQIVRSIGKRRTQIGKLQSEEREFGFKGEMPEPKSSSVPKSTPIVTGSNPFARRGKSSGTNPFATKGPSPQSEARPSEEIEGTPRGEDILRREGVFATPAFTAIPQFKGNWCWAACSQMMRRHYNAERASQSDIVRNALGGYENITYTPVFIGLNHETTADDTPITFEVAKASVPFVYLRGNHYVTCIGYKEATEELLIFNPLPVARGRYELISYATYREHATKTYYRFVQRQRN